MNAPADGVRTEAPVDPARQDAVPVKTARGREELGRRRGDLRPRLRSVLLLADGQRSLASLRSMALQMGGSQGDVDELLRDGFIELPPELAPAPPPVSAAVPEPVAGPVAQLPPEPAPRREPAPLPDLPAPAAPRAPPPSPATATSSTPAVPAVPAVPRAPAAASAAPPVPAGPQASQPRPVSSSAATSQPPATAHPAPPVSAPTPAPLRAQAAPAQAPTAPRKPPRPRAVAKPPVPPPTKLEKPQKPEAPETPEAPDRAAAAQTLHTARDLLCEWLALDGPRTNRRTRALHARVEQAPDIDTLVTLLEEAEGQIPPARRSHQGLLRISELRDVLGLGNTRVAEDTLPGLSADEAGAWASTLPGE